MEPRILLRTHYQAHEPAYLELVVTTCTSATVSAYKETVLEKLFRLVHAGKQFNRAAAGYVVDAAHRLGLLTDRYTWAPPGTLMALTSDVGACSSAGIERLNLGRRLSHLRTFLDGDGAALLYLLNKLRDEGEIAAGGTAANGTATEMFLDVYRQYLELSSNPSDRTRLRRKIDQLRVRPYRGNTGRHKLLLHVNLLHRLGWLDRLGPESLVYRVSEAGSSAIRAFFTDIRTVSDLERWLRAKEAMTLAGRFLATRPLSAERLSTEQFAGVLAEMYRRVVDLGFAVVPVALVVELVQHDLLTRGLELSYKSACERLERLRARNPKQLRYHVDRQGRPAYLVMAAQVP